MELDELFRHYTDPYALAVALVKVYGTRRELLAQAAERWVTTVSDVSTRAYRAQMLSVDGTEAAVWQLLRALPAAEVLEFDPFRTLLLAARKEFTPPDFPGATAVTWEPVLLDVIMSLAPSRQELVRWREILLGVVRHRSDEYVFHLAAHLSDEMPDLAYELLDEAFRRPEPAPQTHYFRRPTGLLRSYGLERVFDPYAWIALSRFGSVPSASLGARDLRLIEAVTPSQYLNDYFELVFAILHGGREAPVGVLQVAKGALDSNDPRVRLRGVAFLARFEASRGEAIDALVRWDEWVNARFGQPRNGFFDTLAAPHGFELANNVTIHGHGLFHGHGWGREKQREHLHCLVGPMLHTKGWSLDPWRAMLGPPLLSREPPRGPELDARVRDIVAEHFFRVAKDASEPPARRRAAITAIGRAQAVIFARDLGKFRHDAELKEVAHQAQQRLRDVNRVGDLAVDVALDLSVRGFLEATS
jgi:hypothetical protein